METIIAVTLLLLTIIVLFLGIVFSIFAARLLDINFSRKTVDKIEKAGHDDYSPQSVVSIDQFIPKAGVPLKTRYSDVDKINKE